MIFDATFSVSPGRLGELDHGIPRDLPSSKLTVNDAEDEVLPVIESHTEEYGDDTFETWAVFKRLDVAAALSLVARQAHDICDSRWRWRLV